MDIQNENSGVKEESTLNNKPIESSGPKRDKDIVLDKGALGRVADETSPVQVIMTRNKFYQDGYRVMQKVAFYEALAILAMIVAFIVMFAFSRPQDKFFATTPDGKLIKLAPLSDPLLQKSAILSFASESAVDVLTFGFHDYRKRLQDASENFTKNGWDSFLTALKDASYIKTITENRQVISAIPLAPPVVIAEGLSGGVYKWNIEVPINLSIESGSQIASRKILVKMVVARRTQVKHEKGLGIDQWVTAPYK
ncbi:MAG: DotI/IcmL family type IV secretion protein [Alphaproteobacteria bacterium]|nr:DotI/IcmL family type IV secretion protein [Alphaproteobacteria bacterium]MCV6599803.1 DotI/IcmL family type IV secretion protein [Alphaproteobacteria bacterium]